MKESRDTPTIGPLFPSIDLRLLTFPFSDRTVVPSNRLFLGVPGLLASNCPGNEFSYFMLMVSNFMLNGVTEVRDWCMREISLIRLLKHPQANGR